MNPINPLDELALRFGTDKSSAGYGYTRIYDRLFHAKRRLPLRLLEIGVDKGASIRMWAEYFPNAQIIGMDIRGAEGCAAPLPGNALIRKGDQTNQNFLDALMLEYGPFNIVIDDGSHLPEHWESSFWHLFPFIAYNGTYCIEDLDAPYSTTWNLGDLRHVDSSKRSFINLAHSFVCMQGRGTIESIRLWPGLMVIEKKGGEA